MATLETYQARINTLKTSIEELKDGDRAVIIRRLDDTNLTVESPGDLLLPFGTTIAGSGAHVFLRVPHSGAYWASSYTRGPHPDGGYDLEQFYDYLCELAAAGKQFRIVYQPGG